MIARRLLITMRRVYYCRALPTALPARVGHIGWAHRTAERFTRLLWPMTAVLILTEIWRPVPLREISSNVLFAICFGCPLVLYLVSLPRLRELALVTLLGAAFTGALGLLQSTVGAPQVIV